MGSIIYTINFDTELYQRINPEYEAGNYSSAIKTAILFLTEEIRERTDLDIDGDTLVTKALSVKGKDGGHILNNKYSRATFNI